MFIKIFPTHWNLDELFFGFFGSDPFPLKSDSLFSTNRSSLVLKSEFIDKYLLRTICIANKNQSLITRIFLEVKLECYGSWRNGENRYLLGRISHHMASSNEETFRCFVSLEQVLRLSIFSTISLNFFLSPIDV